MKPAEVSAKMVEALDAEAVRWVGTPFCENSCVLGAGVSCHMLPAAIYRGARWLDINPAALPHGKVSGWVPLTSNPLLDWFEHEGRRWFKDVTHSADYPPESAGMLHMVRAVCLPFHLVLMLSGGRMVHATYPGGAQIVPSLPDSYRRRIVRSYWPVLSDEDAQERRA